MYNVSFGKFTPAAEQKAKSFIQGMEIAARIPGICRESEINTMKKEMDAFYRAAEDPDFLFDVNPKNVLDEENSKNGKLKFFDENLYLVYKIAKGDDKYSYLGKCKLLQEGLENAYSIRDFVKRCKCMLADKIFQSDESLSYEAAQKEAQKIFTLEA